MEQTTLKYLRIVIPGLIILLGIFPLYQNNYFGYKELQSLDFSYLIFLSTILGSIYYQLSISRIITRPSHSLINQNIINGLISVYESALEKENKLTDETRINEAKRKILFERGKFKNIFYKVIDSDETLKRKANNVYFNGIFWTSTADSLFLNLVNMALYKFIATNIPNRHTLVLLFGLLCICSLLLHVISVIKHIKLSNEQLDYMAIYSNQEIKAGFEKIL